MFIRFEKFSVTRESPKIIVHITGLVSSTFRLFSHSGGRIMLILAIATPCATLLIVLSIVGVCYYKRLVEQEQQGGEMA